MQKNASLLAIVAVYTAENEPSEVGSSALIQQPDASRRAEVIFPHVQIIKL